MRHQAIVQGIMAIVVMATVIIIIEAIIMAIGMAIGIMVIIGTGIIIIILIKMIKVPMMDPFLVLCSVCLMSHQNFPFVIM